MGNGMYKFCTLIILEAVSEVLNRCGGIHYESGYNENSTGNGQAASALLSFY